MATDNTFKNIKESLSIKPIVNTLRSFTMAEIITYFVEIIAADKQPTRDFKSLRESSFQLFKGGHVQKLVVKPGYETLIVKCSCLPEMRKDRVYNILLRLKERSAAIQFAKCDCVAGKGPKASCKHIAAVCYALEEFSRKFISEDELSCTEELMKWNQPRKRRLEPSRISELDFTVEQHGTTKKKSTANLTGRDPLDIIGEVSQTDIEAVNEFITSLESYSNKNPQQKPAFLSVFSSTEKINTFARSSSTLAANTTTQTEASTSSNNRDSTAISHVQSVVDKRITFKTSLNLSEQERNDLYENTKNQSENELWYRERTPRITASICGRIINRMKDIYPTSILKCFKNTPTFTSAETLLGKEQEPFILARYLEYQRENGFPDISAQRAGFLVDKERGWLGASPDGRVDDGKHGTGCVEIKALAGNWDSSINDILTLRKGNFCLHKDEATSELALKTTHIYYNQCQLQLYVGRDRFNWCDFVLSTRRDIFVQRIFLNKEWVEKNIPELENFYDSFVLKKLVV